MREDREFIRFCGRLVFGDGVSAWEKLSGEQQEQFCLRAQKAGWELLFVRCLKDRLPEQFYQRFREQYRKESLKRLIESGELAQLYPLFETEKLPFVPVKGADLAFRIYPDQTLRPHGDWDILFRKADCPRVIHLLQEHGWKTASGYDLREPDDHHYEGMCNGRNSIEVHWTLPNFQNAGEEDIWGETEADGAYRRVLTPEMRLLLLSAHAGNDFYTHVSQWKILLDAGMILKHDPVDWKKVHGLADRWKILRPDILLHVWSEFFPEGVLPPEDTMKEQQKLIREIFETRGLMRNFSSYEKQTAMLEPHGIRWLKKHLKFYNPASICRKYHLPAHHNGKIILYGMRDFFEKSFYYLSHFRSKDKRLCDYYRKVAQLEWLVHHAD